PRLSGDNEHRRKNAGMHERTKGLLHPCILALLRWSGPVLGGKTYPTSTAAATTVVQRPFLSPTAVWVTFWVRTISFESRYTSFFSSQLLSGSNSSPSVVASISAASSSA